MAELKNCPFCGASQKDGYLFIDTIKHHDRVVDVFECYVCCDRCNMVGGPNVFSIDKKEAERLAIESWNERK